MNSTNFFGGFGYFFCLLQWFWTIILYFSLIETIALFFNSKTENQIINNPAPVDIVSNTPLIIIAVIISVIMIVLTIYVIYKIPSTIVRTGKKIVHETAENFTPIVLKIQHKKDTKIIHKKLTIRMIMFIKIMLIIIPVILSLTSQITQEQSFDYSIVIFISLWLACFSLVSFTIQYILASFLSVKMQYLW